MPEPRSARAFLEQLIAASPFVTFRVTLPDSVTRYVSPNVERILGFAPDEIIGIPGWTREHLVHDDQAAVHEQVALAMAARAPEWETEARFLRRDGESQWVAMVVRPEYDGAGNPTEHVVYVWDIVKSRRAQEESRQAREFLDSVIENLPHMIFVKDARDLRFVRINRAGEELLGYPRDTLIGKSDHDFFPPDQADSFTAKDREVLEGGRLVDIPEEPIDTAARGRRILHTKKIPVHDATGRAEFLLGISEDITERRRTEDRFRRVVESVPNAIVVVDQGGTIRLVNPQTEKLFGYARQELIGKPVEILLPASLREGHPAHRAGYLSEPTTRAMGSNRDLYGLHKDGREIPVEVGLNPIETDEGTQVLASVIDITVRKAAEAALTAAEAEAKRANLAKSEFLSRMSHELRTPLNAVLGFAQLLEMDDLTTEQRDSLDHISRGGRHLLELINEVLDISRIEARQMTLSPEPVAVADLLTEVIGLVSPLAGGRSITLDATASGCDVYVLADRQRLTQVLLNLLANAVKYNRDGGSVTVACAGTEGDRLRIRVTDTGYGIPPDQLDRLFRPFERLGADQSTVEGTGLGLALSKGLIEAMGGAIGVESELDRGTTFWVQLDIVEGSLDTYERQRPAVTPIVSASAGRARKLLLIEDNLSNRKLVERALARRPDIELLSAMQGHVGLDLAREHRPDLVLLDLHLPDMPGREILRRLRSYPETRRIPVVIVSADATQGQVARLTDEGAAGYLTKPLDVAAFFELLDRILGDSPSDPR